eukprot:COSAG01_NODE_4113_length_5338_cov_9.585226_4_plen_117_part_00
MRGGTRAQGAPGRKGLLAGEGGGAQQEHQFDGADGRRAGRRGGCMYPGCPREYATLHVRSYGHTEYGYPLAALESHRAPCMGDLVGDLTQPAHQVAHMVAHAEFHYDLRNGRTGTW